MSKRFALVSGVYPLSVLRNAGLRLDANMEAAWGSMAAGAEFRPPYLTRPRATTGTARGVGSAVE